MAKPPDLPTGETTTAVGWGAGTLATVQQFRQTLQGDSNRPFNGRQLTEGAGADRADGCFFDGAAQRGYIGFQVTGAWWIVGRWYTSPYYMYSNTWIDDYVGMTTDLVQYYHDAGKVPCDARAQQLMNICTNGQSCQTTGQYTTDYITYSIDANSVTAGRSNVLAMKQWP